ncbi:DUF262 domain-containing protein [Galactobacillus timonensis]|uniref:DUF262 domain-containing protein n=1 Tax=Galactobacillus timonensis TaxID=2041840 RepID=UPI000C85D7BD|nr:DUF262 domain-containing protein [Galactobacillus timonensis]
MGKELFDNIPSKVGDLLSDVKNGKVGLPDLQRPFVWKDSKTRDLLDSMLKGYPIGYIMLWQSPEGYETINHIGTNDKTYIHPDYLVIDGQQRLTALLAAISGIKGPFSPDPNSPKVHRMRPAIIQKLLRPSFRVSKASAPEG